MRRFLKTLIGAALPVVLSLNCAQAQARTYTTNYVAATSLDQFVLHRFGSDLNIVGSAKLVAPTQSFKIDRRNFPTTILTVPVTYKRTARLDNDLSVFWGGWKKPFVVPAGTDLFAETFYQEDDPTHKIDAWCFDVKWHVYMSDFWNDMCFTKNGDGKAILYSGIGYGNFNHMYDFGELHGLKWPHWFAFEIAKSDQTFDYPNITETDKMPTDMALELRTEGPLETNGASSEPFIAYWVLRGPNGSGPYAGAVAQQYVKWDGKTLYFDMGTEDIAIDYNMETKMGFSTRLLDSSTIGLPKCSADSDIDNAPNFGLFPANPGVYRLSIGIHPEVDPCFSR